MNANRSVARGIGGSFGVAASLGVVSALSNIMTEAQLTGQAPRTLAARFVVSMVLNSPAVWAGIGVFAGYQMRKRWLAMVIAPAALLIALVVHYAFGQLLGIMHPTIWSENAHWLLAAVVIGIPLGIAGATASQPSRVGLAAALIIPAFAIAEPLLFGYFGGLAHPHWPTGVGQLGAGVVLAVAGVFGAFAVCRRWQKARSTTDTQRRSDERPQPHIAACD